MMAMLKMRLKNETLLVEFQKSLLEGVILVLVYDNRYRLLFDLSYADTPDIDELKENIRIQLYPKEEARVMISKRKRFKSDFNLLGDLFNPSLFGWAALNEDNNKEKGQS